MSKNTKLIIWFLLAAFVVSCTQEVVEKPAIRAIIKNHNNRTVYLYRNGEEPILIDSIQIAIDGTFEVPKQKINENGFYFLDVPWQGKLPLFLIKNQYVDILFDANDMFATVHSQSSDLHNRLWSIEKNRNAFSAEMDSLTLQISLLIDKPEDKEALGLLVNQKDSLTQVYRDHTEEILDGNHSPVVEFCALNQKRGNVALYNYTNDLERFFENAEALVEKPELKKLFDDYHHDIVTIYAQQMSVQHYSAGGKFPLLSAKDKDGNSFELDSKATITHVVLWNSEHPAANEKLDQIQSLIKSYNRKGLKTVMVSYSEDPKIWKTSIAKYQLNCNHYIDTASIESSDLEELGVYYLPLNFVVDSMGTIVERDVWGVELESIIKKNL